MTLKRKDETRLLAEQAFWALLQDGTTPTVDSINERLERDKHGKRDRNVVNTAIKACWTKVGERVSSPLAGVPEEAVLLFVKLREDLLAIARTEFDVQRLDLTAQHEARILEVTAESDRTRAEADAARLAKRESDAAFSTLQEEHQRVVSELRTAQGITDELRHQIGQRDHELSIARKELEREQRDRAKERTGAETDRRHQALEIDRLRESVKALEHELSKTREQAQVKIDAVLDRERAALDQAARLQAEIGQLRGAERILKDRIAEMTEQVQQAYEAGSRVSGELAVALDRIERLKMELAENEASLSEMVVLDAKSLTRLTEQAYVAGASQASKVPRDEAGKEPKGVKDPKKAAAEVTRQAHAYAEQTIREIKRGV